MTDLKPCPFCGSTKALPISADRDSQERLFPIMALCWVLC